MILREVYKHLSLQFDEDGNLLPWEKDDDVIHVLSYDEKPGYRQLQQQVRFKSYRGAWYYQTRL